MRINFKYLFIGLMLLAGLNSCQRVISVKVNDAGQQLVIEGNLTDVLGPQSVVITRSVAYNSSNVYPSVSGANVIITDGIGNAYRLPETSTAGTYTIKSLKGKALGLYVISVGVDSKIYTAYSVMPVAVNLDSLTLSNQLFGNSSQITVAVNYHDPLNMSNQYRYIMYVNGVQVKRIFAESDNLTNGRSVATLLFQRDITLKKGDKVDVEMQCIDLGMYNYWQNLSNQGSNSPADSATPANPPSNFDNNALGYFSAHTLQRKSVVVP